MLTRTGTVRAIVTIAWTLTAALSAPAARADPLEEIERFQQALFDRIAPSVVLISTKSGLGSGFFVSADGLVLTNEHVVQGATSVDVVLHDGTRLTGTVVEKAKGDIDLALVQVAAAKEPKPLALGMGGLRVGSWVASVGHGLGGIWTFATGMVTNIYPGDSGRPVFQTQIPVNPGCSGGPIVDRKGNVVGVTTAGVQGANNVNFGIRIDVAMRSFDRLADQCACLVILAPAGVPVFVDDRMVGTGPRVVLPAEERTYEVMVASQGRMRREKVAYPQRRQIDLSK